MIPAEVRKGPRGVTGQSCARLSVIKDLSDWVYGAGIDDHVSEIGFVTSDIAEPPNSLFSNFDVM